MAAGVTTVSFVLNGEEVRLDNVSTSLSLNDWLRSQHGLSGTKRMCNEGGCGCCIVSVTKTDLVINEPTTIAINSCLCPLYSVNGWTITTIEGIGSSKKGFHPIQQKIADYNGTQCGYCTPGMVMNMYSLIQEIPKPTKKYIEDSFDGNICRCTGYRPILDAMKSFAVDSDDIIDVEDVSLTKCSSCPVIKKQQWVNYPRDTSDPVWYQPTQLSDALDIIKTAGSNGMMIKLICGDTGRGIFKSQEKIDAYIDLKKVKELYSVNIENTYISIGSAVPLNQLIDILQVTATKSVSFQPIADHLKKIANVPVRNIGSWAGNLMLTHNHSNFPSDVFTVMQSAGATVTICTANNDTGEYPLRDFLNVNMTNKMILSLQIPYCSPDTVFSSFKIMPRSQNAHAYVNAAFCMKVDKKTMTVKSIPSFIYGGISEHSISVPMTESFMVGKKLTDIGTLRGAIQLLKSEIVPNSPPVAASTQYRKDLAINLFYKFYLKALGSDKVNSLYQSAAVPYIRPVSSGSQTYSADSSQFPINQPMPKLTAALQASGEAEYTTDILHQLGELSAAFVLTTQGNAKILSIDTSPAMAVPGAVSVITAKDIPQNGTNDFVCGLDDEPEKVLATDESVYAGQAVAIAIADTPTHAQQMAQLVTIQYQTMGPPILTIKDAIAAKSFNQNVSTVTIGDADDAINKSDHVVSGEVSCGTQYHFTMETQTAFVIPNDDGYTVYSSTQWTQMVQSAVANILNVSNNKVTVVVKRVGGGYGSKISRAAQIAAGCGLAAHITQRPVRMHMDLETNMKMVGKRYPYYCQYTVGCGNDGSLNGIKVNVYNDAGHARNDSAKVLAETSIDNTYKCPNWTINFTVCKTNTCSNIATRAPGFLPATFIIETIMDNVASSIGMDVNEFKEKNFYKKGDISYVAQPPNGLPLTYCNIDDLWKQISSTADVNNRKQQIITYNKANRWRKRGLSMVPLRYGIGWNGIIATVLVSVYSGDGSVSIVHGGVEIGQGINTKVAQVTASTLDIPISSVTVVPTNSFTNPNGGSTGGSVTSELNCMGALRACQALKSRLDKVKDEMIASGKIADPSWPQIVQKAFENGVDLSEKYFVLGQSPYNFAYSSYGVTVAEVEVDVLTGETQVLRVDILYDCGQSINPEIDVGQVEGAFMMGLGYWLTEKIKYDPVTGQLLTFNTWEYKPPASKDIPIDFRIELLKNAPNPVGILRSKAVGEPPLCMSSAVLYAVKRAIESARHDNGNDQPFGLSVPTTVEDIQQACLVDDTNFTF
jgi:xanthine dehydrogenase/oxidase